MQIHVWLQLIMLLLGYLKLYPRQTGLTVAIPRVSEGLWKYGVIWDLALATLLCLRVYDVAFVMVYFYLGVFLGVSMEPERIYGSSVVQLLPTILLSFTVWYCALCLAIQVGHSILQPAPAIVLGLSVGRFILKVGTASSTQRPSSQ